MAKSQASVAHQGGSSSDQSRDALAEEVELLELQARKSEAQVRAIEARQKLAAFRKSQNALKSSK
jgi:hypothetical protein